MSACLWLAGLLSARMCLAAPVPVIYCSDLFHPHEDPDDHFDLATLFALDTLDVRGIVLDQGAEQLRRPGAVPVSQLEALTGRQVPCAIGLDAKLASTTDGGVARPEQFQAGVGLILRVLRESRRPVTIVITGSSRDVAAAYNREPRLFRRKVRRLYLNDGNAVGRQFEYNVQLDPHAYRRLMESDLPVYWCPCFGGDEVWSTGPHATWWRFRQGELFEPLSPGLLGYFAYALARATSDPAQALSDPAFLAGLGPEWRVATWAQERSMWSTASLLHAAGESLPVFAFERLTWQFAGPDAVALTPPAGDTPRRVFRVVDAERYPSALAQRLVELLTPLGRT